MVPYCQGKGSGVSDLPMEPSPGLVPFRSPESLSVQIQLPHRGHVTGMGIRAGVTLIAGGGFHGKSTLLQALEAGVYNKVGVLEVLGAASGFGSASYALCWPW
eukprot:GHUV01047141.1.p1 GENE.GHUV01047141.1~~GHUV01047141.1.p1  ORF type:complete len:103 (+),score=13.14 GHUV01047141.1:351-659(+)